MREKSYSTIPTDPDATMLRGCTCIIATAELNEKVQEELKIEDPSENLALSAILENTVRENKGVDEK